MTKLDRRAVPAISTNGTHPDALLRATLDARAAIQEAMKALESAAPNGRDYVDRRADFILATGLHKIRLLRLERTASELEELAEAIDAAAMERTP